MTRRASFFLGVRRAARFPRKFLNSHLDPPPERLMNCSGEFFVQNYTSIIYKFLLFSRWGMWYTKLIYYIERRAGTGPAVYKEHKKGEHKTWDFLQNCSAPARSGRSRP